MTMFALFFTLWVIIAILALFSLGHIVHRYERTMGRARCV